MTAALPLGPMAAAQLLSLFHRFSLAVSPPATVAAAAAAGIRRPARTLPARNDLGAAARCRPRHTGARRNERRNRCGTARRTRHDLDTRRTSARTQDTLALRRTWLD